MRWIALLLLTAMLAGCASDKSSETDENTTDTSVDPDGGAPLDGATPDPDGTGITPNVTDAGQIALIASVADGVAPLHVQVTILVADDADWSLTRNGDPSHAGTGEQRVSLTLGEGTHELRAFLVDDPTKEATLVIQVEPAPVPAAKHDFAGKLDAGADASAAHDFSVPARSKGITAVLKWIEDAEDTVDQSVRPWLWELDLELVSPSGETYVLEADAYEAGTIENPEAGAWRVELDAPRPIPPLEYTLELIVWGDTLREEVFEGTLQGVNLGEPTPEQSQTAPAQHVIEAPAGTMAVAAFLTWVAGDGTPCDIPSRQADYDLRGTVEGQDAISSAKGGVCEADLWAGDGEGTWIFDVIPFLTPETDYTLTVLYG